MKEDRVVYPDLLRIIAVFFVIAIHVTSVGIKDYSMNSTVWVFCLALNSLSRWAVPVFYMISGMFLLNPDRKFEVKEFYKKNVLRIVRCIVFWGFLYSMLDQFLYGTISTKSIAIAFYGILTDGTGYHLWFLYTLLLLYIATPVLRILTEHATKEQFEYALIIWFVFSLLVGQINALMKELFGMNQLMPFEAITITGYAGYYLLGAYVSIYESKRKQNSWALVCLGTAAVLLLVVGNLILATHFDLKNVTSWESPLGLLSFVVAVVLFRLLQKLPTEAWNAKTRNSISILGRQTFGIYLTHVFFVSLFFRILKLSLTAIWVLPWCGIVFVCSWITTVILMRLPGIKKLV